MSMGASQRTKGHNFERKVASLLRTAFPDALVERGQQGAGGALHPDVAVWGTGTIADRLWIECQCSRAPNPRAKLAQAEADSSTPDYDHGFGPIPIVVWQRTGSAKVHATLTLESLRLVARLSREPWGQHTDPNWLHKLGMEGACLVTLEFLELLDMVKVNEYGR